MGVPKLFMKRLRVFISYSGKDGKSFAIQTNNILTKLGYKTWFYPHNRTFGYLPWEEISEVILNKTEIFLYLCTISSTNSRGQSFESEYAMVSTYLMPQLVLVDNSTCPQKLRIFNHERVSSNNFSDAINKIAQKLPAILEKTPMPKQTLKAGDISN